MTFRGDSYYWRDQGLVFRHKPRLSFLPVHLNFKQLWVFLLHNRVIFMHAGTLPTSVKQEDEPVSL